MVKLQGWAAHLQEFNSCPSNYPSSKLGTVPSADLQHFLIYFNVLGFLYLQDCRWSCLKCDICHKRLRMFQNWNVLITEEYCFELFVWEMGHILKHFDDMEVEFFLLLSSTPLNGFIRANAFDSRPWRNTMSRVIRPVKSSENSVLFHLIHPSLIW